MPPRQPVPRIWLMTDERLGTALWRAIRALPRGAGIVFRHHATDPAQRRRLFARVVAMTRGRRIAVLRAGDAPLRGEDGMYGTGKLRPGGVRGWPVHSRAEAIAGRRAGADVLFVSPIHPTRTHPGAAHLGPRAAARIMRGLTLPAVALGGMDARRFATLKPRGFYGWAAIDAWVTPSRRYQKRKAVPI